MRHRHEMVWFLFGGIAVCSVLVYELSHTQTLAAPPPAPSAAPAASAVSPNVNVVNTPTVHVVNTPTVHVQERNWQYRAEVIPKAFPGTPEWTDFVNRLNGYGQQGWELVNIVESVALMKKGI